MNPGTIAAVPNADIYPHSDPVEVTNVVIFTGMVLIELVRNSDSRNSVQENMKQRTAVAAMPPLIIGTTTR